MSQPAPFDHNALGVHVIRYLAAQGVVADPEGDQRAAGGTLPAVYLGDMEDEPDRAVAFIGPWITQDDEGNPAVRFFLVGRGTPGDPLGPMVDLEAAHRALWHTSRFELTAGYDLAYCERVITDPPVPDENGRSRRVDTYQARLRVPHSYQTSNL